MPSRKQLNLKDTRKTVGYCRVSTDEQSTKGVSLLTQRERIEAFAVATGRVLDDVVIDRGKSAKSLDRSGLDSIRKGVRDGSIGTVIILKLDRITRSVRDLGTLLDEFTEAKTDLVSVGESLDTGSAAGRLVVNLLGSVSQWEREAIAERTASALETKRRNGQAYGRTPFGYAREGDRLIEQPNQQRALRLMRRLRDRDVSFAEIARRLTRNGYAPPKGTAWYPSSVHAVLNSRMAEDAAA